MKNILISWLLLIGLGAHAQNILRVNNTPTVNAPYTTIDAAIAAASAGDIILVDGSATAYSLPANYTLTKQVDIKGPGYLLSVNTGLQANPNPATLSMSGSFTFGNGSEGSSITGMTIPFPLVVNVSSISIRQNQFNQIIINNTTPASNLVIHGNYQSFAVANAIYSTGTTANTTYTNIEISNNIIVHWMQLGTTKYGIFANNNVIWTFGGCCTLTHLSNLDFVNNIVSAFGTWTFLSPSVQNNVFCGSGWSFDPALNNILNQNITSVFVGTGTSENYYALKSGSQAIGVGLGGTDAGIFGGLNPYRLSGIATGQHTIHNLLVPASVIQNGTLNVKVSAKVN